MDEGIQPRILIQNNLRTGLTTYSMLDNDPAGVRVTWIAWDSGFRGCDLQVGDQIIAVNGKPITRPNGLEEQQRALRELPGGLNEGQVLAETGLKDGSPFTLTLRRRRCPGEGWLTQDVTGKILAERIYSYPTGRHAMGPTGPEQLANDGFNGAWAIWYEKQIFEWTRVLDDSWYQSRIDTRRALQGHLEEKPRVDFLFQKYPGPFAKAVQSDWETVRTCLEGTLYSLTPEALDYRKHEDEQVKQVAALAASAWEAFLDKHVTKLIPAFPSVDPLRGDRTQVIGKLVKLPPIEPQHWLVSIDVPYLSATEAGYWYFAAVQSFAMRQVFKAIYRYKRYVSPEIREDIALVGRILPEPRMMLAQRRTVVGLEIEPIAAFVGKVMFVDLSILDGEDSPFAGEDGLKKQASSLPPHSAPPREVLEALITALKANDQATWNALFADWRNVSGEGKPLYYPYYQYSHSSRNEDWIRSRRLMLDKIYDVRVVWVSEPRTVLQGDEFAGAPFIEEVRLEIEHIGLFDGEYRAFNFFGINRIWSLQRRNGSSWRISSQQGI